MKKHIPYRRLSKKMQREIDKQQRVTWGIINPVTRRKDSSKTYNRKKDQYRNPEFPSTDPLCFLASDYDKA